METPTPTKLLKGRHCASLALIVNVRSADCQRLRGNTVKRSNQGRKGSRPQSPKLRVQGRDLTAAVALVDIAAYIRTRCRYVTSVA